MLAGFARLDVTPPLGISMAGYYRQRNAEGILDNIELNAVAFSDGESTSVIIAADCLGVNMKCADYIRNLIESELGVPQNNVIITVGHSHTSFNHAVLPNAESFESIGSREYLNVLNRKYVDVARLAIADMKEATFSVGTAETSEQIAFIRRYLMKDGRVEAFPKPLPNPDIVRSLGEPDNTLRLIRIDRKGAKSIAVANFQTHADTTKGTLLSADWPGHSRRFFEEEHPDTYCIMLVGAQGDSNHINPNKEGSQSSPECSRRIGRIIADAINEAWGTTKSISVGAISSEYRVVYNRTRTDGLERLDEAKKYIEDYQAKLVPSNTQLRAEMGRITRIPASPVFQQIPLTVMKLGDIIFIGFGGEAFTEYANRSRAAAPDKFVTTLIGANGFQGYFPTRSAFEDGGYESGVTAFTPTLEEEVMNTIFEMLK